MQTFWIHFGFWYTLASLAMGFYGGCKQMDRRNDRLEAVVMGVGVFVCWPLILAVDSWRKLHDS